MANDLFVHHAVSGGVERSGPFKSINQAIQRACALPRRELWAKVGDGVKG
jgi:hypothetical protein